MTSTVPSASEPTDIQRWLEFGDLRINIDGIRVFCCGGVVDMGLREFRLLCFLVQNPNVTHSRAGLVQAVWPSDTSIRPSTVDTYILRLRIALRSGGSTGVIRTVRAKGYELDGTAQVPACPVEKRGFSGINISFIGRSRCNGN